MDASLKERRVPVDAALAVSLGIDGRHVFANFEALHRKHPTHFPGGPEDVQRHVESVMAGPSHILPGAEADHRLVVRRMKVDRAVAVEIVLRGGKHRIRSAYVLDPGQFETKVRKALNPSTAVPEPIPGSRPRGQIVQGGGAPSECASVDERGFSKKERASSRKKSTPSDQARKVNPAPAFGSRERTKAYGYKKGGHGSGARADRRRKRQASRKTTARAQDNLERFVKLQAEGKRLTKTQEKALARAEARLQAEGAIPDDAELMDIAKAHQAQERAIESVLGPDRQTYAMKIAPKGRTLRRADLEALQNAGWTLRSAGTISAQVGRTLAALNPGDPLERLLGRQGEVRAVVIQSPVPFGEDLVHQFREDGFDVSPAQREIREKPASTVVGQEGTREDTARRGNPEDEPMRKKTTGRKKAAITSKARGPKAHAKEAKAKKPARPALRPAKKAPHAPKSGASPSAAKRKPVRAALALNPTDAEGLAKVWKAWTGADPDGHLKIDVEDAGRFKLPRQVVLLGRVSWLATKDGQEKRFGVSGPLMVTDAKAQRIWLVSAKGQRFDLEPALIGYLARKPKFGDKGLIEYVHAFEGRAHAVMSGQVGALTGTFRITPAGLEG